MGEPTLEERIEAHQTRLRESLARPRGEAVQRVAHLLYDLRLSLDFRTIQDFEGRLLSGITEARRGVDDIKGLSDGYSRALVEQEQEATQAKLDLERLNPLDVSRERVLAKYHLAVADADVYREAREAIQVSVTELERGLQRVLQSLERAVERYVDEKTMAMAEEAQRALEKAEGELRRATELKQRAAAFPREFRAAYGLEQEGHNGITKA